MSDEINEDGQTVNNEESVDTQVNTTGDVYLTKKSRISKRFDKLNNEVSGAVRYTEVLDELKRYLTDQDSLGLEQKLEDGGFTAEEIRKAAVRKELYWKKHEKYKYYESAQKIDVDLFAKIIIEFETHIECLIKDNQPKELIRKTILDKIVNPILELLNEEGEHDDNLNYNAEEIYGMIYHLTGKCHLNWTDYDNL
jgi:hypothetical protein